MSKHLKKFAAPTTWPITKKDFVYITKPSAGPHPHRFSMSLDLIIRTLGYAKTKREIKKIMITKEILVDGNRIHDSKFPAGLFDVVSIPAINKQFRIVFDEKGRLKLLEIQKNEANKKIAKIVGKKILKGGKMQLNLSDSRNILTTDKKFTVGDTLLLEVPSQKIHEHFKLEKGALIYLVDGKHVTDTGLVDDINKQTISYTNAAKQQVKTLKTYAYVVGKTQPAIKLQ